MKGLFGDELPDVDPRASNDFAHPARPGTGPAGKACRDCAHLRKREASRAYYKCGLVKPTHGPGTDIRLRDAACMFFDDQGGVTR